MTAVAVCAATGGVGVTTTTVVLAANWPANDVSIAELDPTGGDLAAWCDGSDMTGTAALAARRWDGTLATLEAECWSRLATGTPVLCGPTRHVAAAAVIDAVAPALLHGFAESNATLLVDCGQLAVGRRGWIDAFEALIVVGRQDPSSVPVSAARLDRTGELIDSLRPHGLDVFALSIGEQPFSATAISTYLGVPTFALANDPLGASLLANPNSATRTVSRCALYRSGRVAAARLASMPKVLPVGEGA